MAGDAQRSGFSPMIFTVRMSAMAESDDNSNKRNDTRAEPPAVYFPACGVLCDIFWWARRNDAKAEAPADPPEPARDSK